MNLNKNQMRRIKQIHFVGIGGSGMAGIAEVLFNRGYRITGSDLVESSNTDRLKKLGITIFKGHAAENIAGSDALVMTSALKADNPEWLAACKQGIPVVRRAEMLAELMRFLQGIAIAGTHGKTTTTSLIASIMGEAGLDPTFVIGGRLNSIGSHAQLGTGRYFVAEADESDASFLYLKPVIAVVTNIDRDHMVTYGGDFQKLRQVFIDFLHHLPFYGLAVLCIDDPVVRDILRELHCPRVTYGFSPQADYWISDFRQQERRSYFTVHAKDRHPFSVCLNLAGKHNALNALAAMAVCFEEGIALANILSALEVFGGIGRRFQIEEQMLTAHQRQYMLIDDYGHHPKEVAMVIEAIRTGWSDRRLVMIYQPHRYSRTHDLFNDFVTVLSCVDVLILLPVYSAGELPISGADSQSLHQVIHQLIDQPADQLPDQVCQRCIYQPDLEGIPGLLSDIVLDGDIVVTQGAGSVGQLLNLLRA